MNDTTCAHCRKDDHRLCDGQRWSEHAQTLLPCTCNCAYAMERRAFHNQPEDPPTLRLRDRHAQNPHLRVQAPCLIHPGQTIDIDLTDGTVTVRDTP